MRLEAKIKEALHYIGLIGSALMCVAYIITAVILVQGFSTRLEWTNSIVFSAINAVVGCIIMQFLKVQGIEFAKALPENKELIARFYNTKTKARKLHSVRYYWITTVVKDVLIKGITLAATTFGMIYIVIQGSHDYHLLLLAVVNLIMFICFGLLSMNSAYDFYNQEHIAWIKEQLNQLVKPIGLEDTNANN